MKKGFTLVELLGVIVILGIIGLIVTPLVLGSINDSETSVNEMQSEIIKRAAKNYANSHIYDFDCDNCTKYVTIGELKEAGFLEDKQLVDATNDEVVDDSTRVAIVITNGKFSYKYPVD